MAKPWDHKPGKVYHPNLPEDQVEKKVEKRSEYGEKWDKIFSKKKLNNMEDNDDDV